MQAIMKEVMVADGMVSGEGLGQRVAQRLAMINL